MLFLVFSAVLGTKTEDQRRQSPFLLPESVLEESHDAIKSLLIQQALVDQKYDECTPRLDEPFEEVRNPSGVLHRFRLDKRIARGSNTLVFYMNQEDAGTTARIVKYQSNCFELESIQALLRDFWFLRIVEPLDVALRAFFLSPPAKFPLEVSEKSDFRMTFEEREECAARPESNVRFMVMEKGKYPLRKFLDYLHEKNDEPFRFKQAFKVGRALVENLQVLHNHGIVHGDIHMGNAVMSKDNFVRLIDFGAAFFEKERELLPAVQRENMTDTNCLHSHWNYEGYRKSMRDDVYRSMLVVALLANGPELYSQVCKSESPTPLERYHWKRFGFIFDGLDGTDIIERTFPKFTPEKKKLLRDRLENILKAARAPENVWTMPDYGSIIADLDFVLENIQLSD